MPQDYWSYILVLALCLCLPYALALLLWGRSLARGVGGAGVAVVAGLVLWAINWVFQDHIWSSGVPGRTSLRVYDWSILLTMAVLVPLAWGVARRSGRSWTLGLLVGLVVAVVLRELQVRSWWWQNHVSPGWLHPHWQIEAVVYVAPFVLAVLAGWALEARGMESSA